MPDPKVTGTKVMTGEVRLSYARLFEPRAGEDGGKPAYSCMLIIPKTEKKTLAALEKAREAAIENGKAKHFGGKVPPKLYSTLRDADEEIDLDDEPHMAGCMFMNVKTFSAPGLIDRQRMPITDASELKSGDYVRVELNAGTYNTQGNKGTTFYLNHVQKLRDGESLGGAPGKAEDAFDDDLEPLDEDDSNLI